MQLQNHERKDDVLIKWLLGVSASIVVLFVGQFVFVLQSNATTVERVNNNTASIKELKDFNAKLIRIEVMSEMTIDKVNELAGHMKAIDSRTTTIERQAHYVKNFRKNK